MMPEYNGHRQKIAIIGTGISGLSAAWLLNNAADITVFEQDLKIGGHSHTEDVATPAGPLPVDMGFIVYNEHAYQNLTALFDHLDIATKTTIMSFAVSLDDGRMEYAGGYVGQLLAQRRNLIRPRFWSMLSDLVRFYRNAPDDLDGLEKTGMTLGEYLNAHNYGRAFCEDHLLPMAAAIWSMPTEDVLGYPAHAFIRFHDNHGLLKLSGRPLWRTVTGGSRAYVEKLSEPFSDRIKKGVKVLSVERRSDGVILHTSKRQSERYDQVVIAAHADQALALLAQPTSEEQRLLGAFRYTKNEAVLHCDERLMPNRRRAWASWNYIGSNRSSSTTDLMVTYWMNSLQALPETTPLFVTLNPNRDIEEDKIYQKQQFKHPVIDNAALAAQQKLWSLQGQQGVWYCGAYFGSGFHEDGLQAGLAVAEAITGCRRPWRVVNESGRIVLGAAQPRQILEGAAA